MGEYTFLALAAPVVVVAFELLVFRTGLFRDIRYWAAVVIGLTFQIPVDGWLTRANAPIVVYSEQQISGLRFPMNIPVEDFGFGFALITSALSLWRWLRNRQDNVSRRQQGNATQPRTELRGEIQGEGGA